MCGPYMNWWPWGSQRGQLSQSPEWPVGGAGSHSPEMRGTRNAGVHAPTIPLLLEEN